MAERPTVLVVEDEALIGMWLEQMLMDLGCASVTIAGTVSQALELIDSEKFDAATLDLNLNGLEILLEEVGSEGGTVEDRPGLHSLDHRQNADGVPDVEVGEIRRPNVPQAPTITREDRADHVRSVGEASAQQIGSYEPTGSYDQDGTGQALVLVIEAHPALPRIMARNPATSRAHCDR